MCGIAGIYSGNLKFLVSASEKLRHRGPDDYGIFINSDAGIGLAHRRLSILDTSNAGHQPMISEDGQVVLVFNGEIYNFRELRSELEALGRHFKGNTDTEVLLQLYLSEGESALSKLNGIFAFAIWDARKESLFLARDALGVKPLYFSNESGVFTFASEIKSLLELVSEEKILDCVALDRYLSFLWCPGERTPLKNIKKLGPGEALWVKYGKIERHFSWYSLPVFRNIKPHMSEGEALFGVELHLRQAVHRQMVADVPVGAFLSGGLDSSAVVTFAREVNPNIACFTIEEMGGKENGVISDLPYAKEVAKHLKVPLEIIRIDPLGLVADLKDMVYQLDEPLADPAPLNVLYISRVAKEGGMKVLLSGLGGDDIFTGYRRHWAVESDQYWGWLPKVFRTRLESLFHGLDNRRALTRRLEKFFSGVSLDGDARLVNFFRRSNREDLMRLYSPAFRSELEHHQDETPMLEFLSSLSPDVSSIERILSLEQRFFLPDHNLIYTDKMSMAAGVEVRVPFLDLELVEFAAKIPSKFKQNGNVGKWILKRAMEPYLPKNIIYRPKTGFGAPLRQWMREELREFLADTLSIERLKNRGLFEPQAVQELIASNDSGLIDASYTLLSLMCIELWCEKFIDKDWAAV